LALLNGHSIIYVQFSETEDTRTYLDYDNLDDGLESMCRIYESIIINKNPEEQSNSI
jgi:hypothetical protein